jgi:hypothetical protein
LLLFDEKSHTKRVAFCFITFSIRQGFLQKAPSIAAHNQGGLIGRKATLSQSLIKMG